MTEYNQLDSSESARIHDLLACLQLMLTQNLGDLRTNMITTAVIFLFTLLFYKSILSKIIPFSQRYKEWSLSCISLYLWRRNSFLYPLLDAPHNLGLGLSAIISLFSFGFPVKFLSSNHSFLNILRCSSGHITCIFN